MKQEVVMLEPSKLSPCSVRFLVLNDLGKIKKNPKMSKAKMIDIIDNLYDLVDRLG